MEEEKCVGETKGMKRTVLFCNLLFLFVAGCVLISVYGCKKKETRAERIVNVTVQPVEKKQLRPFITATGTLNPYEEVSIGAETDGIVKSVMADEGTDVKKGMLLALIDDAEYQHGVTNARAALKQTETTLANTKIEFSRKEALYKEELVTKQQFDDASTRLALADSEVERAKAALSIATQKLTKTRIYAPIASKVKQKLVTSGDFVKNGSRLFTLIQPNPLKLLFSVPERDVGKIKVGQDVLVSVDAYPDREFKGKVHIVFPSLDEKTRTLAVEAVVPDEEKLLKPGLFARVLLYTGGERNTPVVPVTSLLYEGEQIRLYVVEDGLARERNVKLGGKYNESIEILEGVKEGERVVVVGQQGLSEGSKVNVQKDNNVIPGQLRRPEAGTGVQSR